MRGLSIGAPVGSSQSQSLGFMRCSCCLATLSKTISRVRVYRTTPEVDPTSQDCKSLRAGYDAEHAPAAGGCGQSPTAGSYRHIACHLTALPLRLGGAHCTARLKRLSFDLAVEWYQSIHGRTGFACRSSVAGNCLLYLEYLKSWR